MVWYAKDDFDAAGYTVPETWDDLVALSDEMVADGNTPWCVGFEAGGDTGWPATDWMEDIILGSAGTETYTQWINHDIPFTDPAVVHAGELFGEAMFTEGYVLGGAENTPATAFADAPAPLFEDPPGCFMHRQASFITAFFEGAESGVDYDWFPMPGESQRPTLFAGELATVFSNRPEVVEFLEAFMGEEVQCAMGSEPGSSRISPNVNVGPDCYTDPILAEASEVLTAALAGEGAPGFDASDQMPPQVGSGSFWTEMMGYMEDGCVVTPDAPREHRRELARRVAMERSMGRGAGLRACSPPLAASGEAPRWRPTMPRRSADEPSGAQTFILSVLRLIGSHRDPDRSRSSSSGGPSTSSATRTRTACWSWASRSSWAWGACSSSTGR